MTLLTQNSYAQTPAFLPDSGTLLDITPAYSPAILRGVKVNPEEPFQLNFILDPGDSLVTGTELSTNNSEPVTRLIKYFLASLTIPEEDLWVNLSPYEKDRIIPHEFGATEMGRDMLAQDYLLKQLTASLMYPENELGKKFWDKIYAEAYKKYGTTEIPMNTFNKVWIVPEKAVVYEHGDAAYVVESKLKVMLEQDYLASKQYALSSKQKNILGSKKSLPTAYSVLSTQIIKELIIPAIEKEVNEGEHFAKLRQIYNSMILATWFKRNLKESLLGQIYVGKNKVKGVDIEDKNEKQKIYEQYLETFKKGVYDYIKEEYDPQTQSIVPRKYFSGGLEFGNKLMDPNIYQSTQDSAMLSAILNNPESKLLEISTEVVSINKLKDVEAFYSNQNDQAMIVKNLRALSKKIVKQAINRRNKRNGKFHERAYLPIEEVRNEFREKLKIAHIKLKESKEAWSDADKKKIGMGGVAEVYRDLNEPHFIYKVASNEISGSIMDSNERIMSEIIVLSKLKKLAKKNEIDLIMEWGVNSEGALWIKLRSFEFGFLIKRPIWQMKTAYEKLQIIMKGARVLKEVHDLNYVHNDVKPDNFIFSSGNQVHLTDFSHSMKKGTKGFQMVGAFAAPDANREPAADVFSLGVTLWDLFIGGVPINRPNSMEPYDPKLDPPIVDIFRSMEQTQIKEDIKSSGLYSLIEEMIQADPEDRLTMDQVLLKLEKILSYYKDRKQGVVSGGMSKVVNLVMNQLPTFLWSTREDLISDLKRNKKFKPILDRGKFIEQTAYIAGRDITMSPQAANKIFLNEETGEYFKVSKSRDLNELLTQAAIKIEELNPYGALKQLPYLEKCGFTEEGLFWMKLRGIKNGKRLSESEEFKNLKESEKIALFVKLCEVLDNVHSKGIVHADIHPDNILFNGKDIMIIDFNGSRYVGESYGHGIFQAPEKEAHKRTDVFALGGTLRAFGEYFSSVELQFLEEQMVVEKYQERPDISTVKEELVRIQRDLAQIEEVDHAMGSVNELTMKNGARFLTTQSRGKAEEIMSSNSVYKFVSKDSDQVIAGQSSWRTKSTPLLLINDRFDIKDAIVQKFKAHKEESAPFVVMGWGCGKGRALIELKKELESQGIYDVVYVGYSDEFYPEWEDAPYGINFIFDHPENLKQYFDGKILPEKVDFIYSYLGLEHFATDYPDAFEAHLYDLAKLLKYNGEIRTSQNTFNERSIENALAEMNLMLDGSLKEKKGKYFHYDSIRFLKDEDSDAAMLGFGDKKRGEVLKELREDPEFIHLFSPTIYRDSELSLWRNELISRGGYFAKIYRKGNSKTVIYKVSRSLKANKHLINEAKRLFEMNDLGENGRIQRLLSWGIKKDGRFWMEIERLKEASDFSDDRFLTLKTSLQLEGYIQVAESLDAVHQKGYAHNDVKSTNMAYALVKKKGKIVGINARMIDFGLSESIGTEINWNRYTIEHPDLKGTDKSDVFLFAISMMRNSLRRIDKKSFQQSGLKSLIENMQQAEPEDRPTMAVVIEQLKIIKRYFQEQEAKDAAMSAQDIEKQFDLETESIKKIIDSYIERSLSYLEILKQRIDQLKTLLSKDIVPAKELRRIAAEILTFNMYLTSFSEDDFVDPLIEKRQDLLEKISEIIDVENLIDYGNLLHQSLIQGKSTDSYQRLEDYQVALFDVEKNFDYLRRVVNSGQFLGKNLELVRKVPDQAMPGDDKDQGENETRLIHELNLYFNKTRLDIDFFKKFEKARSFNDPYLQKETQHILLRLIFQKNWEEFETLVHKPAFNRIPLSSLFKRNLRALEINVDKLQEAVFQNRNYSDEWSYVWKFANDVFSGLDYLDSRMKGFENFQDKDVQISINRFYELMYDFLHLLKELPISENYGILTEYSLKALNIDRLKVNEDLFDVMVSQFASQDNLFLVFKEIEKNVKSFDKDYTVRAELTENKDQIKIIYQNKGQIAPEDRENIFKWFYSSRAKKGNRGAGLPISKLILEAHSGNIEIENGIDDEGRKVVSTIVTLPVNKDAAMRTADFTLPQTSSDVEWEDLFDQGYRLVLDDVNDNTDLGPEEWHFRIEKNGEILTNPKLTVGPEEEETSEIVVLIFPKQKIFYLSKFYPRFPVPQKDEEKNGKGRALLRHLISQYPGFTFLAIASSKEMKESVSKITEMHPILDPAANQRPQMNKLPLDDLTQEQRVSLNRRIFTANVAGQIDDKAMVARRMKKQGLKSFELNFRLYSELTEAEQDALYNKLLYLGYDNFPTWGKGSSDAFVVFVDSVNGQAVTSKDFIGLQAFQFNGQGKNISAEGIGLDVDKNWSIIPGSDHAINWRGLGISSLLRRKVFDYLKENLSSTPKYFIYNSENHELAGQFAEKQLRLFQDLVVPQSVDRYHYSGRLKNVTFDLGRYSYSDFRGSPHVQYSLEEDDQLKISVTKDSGMVSFVEAETALKRLGLGPEATPQEMKARLRELVRKWHPDHNKGNEAQAAAKFRAVYEAYETIVKYSESHGIAKEKIIPQEYSSLFEQGWQAFMAGAMIVSGVLFGPKTRNPDAANDPNAAAFYDDGWDVTIDGSPDQAMGSGLLEEENRKIINALDGTPLGARMKINGKDLWITRMETREEGSSFFRVQYKYKVYFIDAQTAKVSVSDVIKGKPSRDGKILVSAEFSDENKGIIILDVEGEKIALNKDSPAEIVSGQSRDDLKLAMDVNKDDLKSLKFYLGLGEMKTDKDFISAQLSIVKGRPTVTFEDIQLTGLVFDEKSVNLKGLGILSEILKVLNAQGVALRLINVNNKELQNAFNKTWENLIRHKWPRLLTARDRTAVIGEHNIDMQDIKRLLGEDYSEFQDSMNRMMLQTPYGRALTNAGFKNIGFNFDQMSSMGSVFIIKAEPDQSIGDVGIQRLRKKKDVRRQTSDVSLFAFHGKMNAQENQAMAVIQQNFDAALDGLVIATKIELNNGYLLVGPVQFRKNEKPFLKVEYKNELFKVEIAKDKQEIEFDKGIKIKADFEETDPHIVKLYVNERGFLIKSKRYVDDEPIDGVDQIYLTPHLDFKEDKFFLDFNVNESKGKRKGNNEIKGSFSEVNNKTILTFSNVFLNDILLQKKKYDLRGLGAFTSIVKSIKDSFGQGLIIRVEEINNLDHRKKLKTTWDDLKENPIWKEKLEEAEATFYPGEHMEVSLDEVEESISLDEDFEEFKKIMNNAMRETPYGIAFLNAGFNVSFDWDAMATIGSYDSIIAYPDSAMISNSNKTITDKSEPVIPEAVLGRAQGQIEAGEKDSDNAMVSPTEEFKAYANLVDPEANPSNEEYVDYVNAMLRKYPDGRTEGQDRIFDDEATALRPEVAVLWFMVGFSDDILLEPTKPLSSYLGIFDQAYLARFNRYGNWEKTKSLFRKLHIKGTKETGLVLVVDSLQARLSLHQGLLQFEKIDYAMSDVDKRRTKKDERRKGGIDFNPNKLNLEIRRDENGKPLDLKFQSQELMEIDGLTPIIINIAPIASLPLFLGLNTDPESSEKHDIARLSLAIDDRE